MTDVKDAKMIIEAVTMLPNTILTFMFFSNPTVIIIL